MSRFRKKVRAMAGRPTIVITGLKKIITAIEEMGHKVRSPHRDDHKWGEIFPEIKDLSPSQHKRITEESDLLLAYIGAPIKIKLQNHVYIQLVLATYQTIMVATKLAFWAGVDFSLCFNRVFFRQSILDGCQKRNYFDCRFAFRPKPDFQSCVHAFAIWAQK